LALLLVTQLPLNFFNVCTITGFRP
jgi:hypothetical protein